MDFAVPGNTDNRNLFAESLELVPQREPTGEKSFDEGFVHNRHPIRPAIVTFVEITAGYQRDFERCEIPGRYHVAIELHVFTPARRIAMDVHFLPGAGRKTQRNIFAHAGVLNSWHS